MMSNPISAFAPWLVPLGVLQMKDKIEEIKELRNAHRARQDAW